MLIDARSVPNQQVLETDVCIIGGGVAGITLAREFREQPFQVCLVESGGFKSNSVTQSLYRGESVGRDYFPLDTCRIRFFGGSSNRWGGWCRPLDAIDFQERSWVPYSGWPITRQELQGYYERAQPICQLGPYGYDLESLPWRVSGKVLPLRTDRVWTGFFQFSPQTRFGSVYRQDLLKASNIKVLLYANVVEIGLAKDGGVVNYASIATLSKNSFRVCAKLFVLATGGIENARLLLASNRDRPAGLGNDHGLVGRFFMEHLHVQLGSFVPVNPEFDASLYNERQIQGRGYQGALFLKEELLREERMLNFCATLVQKLPIPTLTASSMELREYSLFKGRIRASAVERMPDKLLQKMISLMRGIDQLTLHLYIRWLKMRRKTQLFEFMCRSEQAPNPESRVMLGSERDRVGMLKAKLDWRLTEQDTQTISAGVKQLGQEIGDSGLGRVYLPTDQGESWSHWIRGGPHHMGTTRMAVSPKEGVVNEHCCVHGLANLYVAGSSVFPTSGAANPTLTIVAFSLRLADHIKKRLR